MSLTQEELQLAMRTRVARIAMAQSSAAEFNRYVLRDEESGLPVENAEVHEKWHRFIDRCRNIVIWAAIELGKTSSITVGRSLYELGKNPNIRIVIVSKTQGQATKVVRAIAKYIETSAELHQVFPDLKPSVPWTHNAITIQRPNATIRDPSVQATGVHGSVLGTRCDLLILDDILSHENARTAAQRLEVIRWYRSTLAGRITTKGRVIVVGTAWHPDDLMHELAKQPNFRSAKFAVLNAKGELTWPERWSTARIADKRVSLGELEARRQLDCVAVDDSMQRFKEEWIVKALDVTRAQRIPLMPTLRGVALPPGCYVTTGVDLGFSPNKRAGAQTVFTTVLFYPDGIRQLLWVEHGHFDGPETLHKAMQHHSRYGSVIFVESNGAQRLLLDFALDPLYSASLRELVGGDFDPGSVPIRPFETGTNKWHPTYGVESLAIELEHGNWLIPNDDGIVEPAVEGLLADLRGYNPQEHTGDFLMSMWFAREGGRGRMLGPSRVNATVITPEVNLVPGEDGELVIDPKTYQRQRFGRALGPYERRTNRRHIS